LEREALSAALGAVFSTPSMGTSVQLDTKTPVSIFFFVQRPNGFILPAIESGERFAP